MNLNLELCRKIKNKLSKALLSPDFLSSVFGVGVGIERKCVDRKVVGASYHIRLYSDSVPGSSVIDKVKSELGITNSTERGFPLGFTDEETKITIKNIQTIRPRLASNPVISHHKKDACLVGNDLLNRLSIKGNILEPQIFRAGMKIDSEYMSGTLGYFVKDKDGNNCLLSNSHVIADFGYADEEEVIYFNSKAIANLVKPPFVIEFGEFTDDEQNLQYYSYKYDAAIAKLNPNLEPDISIANRWSRSGTQISDVYCFTTEDKRTDPEKSFRVSKHGATTCETGGWIDDVDCDFLMDEPGESPKVALFVNQFRVIRTKEANIDFPDQHYTFADEGDSGSLVFDNEDFMEKGEVVNTIHRAIGLLFAVGVDENFRKTNPFKRKGETQNNHYAVVTPISVIEQELEVELICNQHTNSYEIL